MEQLYSEAAGKFLADRFVSGTCPKCSYEVRAGQGWIAPAPNSATPSFAAIAVDCHHTNTNTRASTHHYRTLVATSVTSVAV